MRAIDTLLAPWSRHPTWWCGSSPPQVPPLRSSSVITPGDLRTAVADVLGRGGTSAALAIRTIPCVGALFSHHKRLHRLEHGASATGDYLIVWGVERCGRQLEWSPLFETDVAPISLVRPTHAVDQIADEIEDKLNEIELLRTL